MRFIIFLFILLPSVIFSQSTTFSINVTADDYSEETVSDGNIYSGSSDLELCYDGGNNGGQQIVGIHFSNVSVPQGVTVTNCYLQFQADE